MRRENIAPHATYRTYNMLEFNKLGKNVEIIRNYAPRSEISFCDISAGVKYMWRDEFVAEYAEIDGTLILRETCPDYKNAFYYPIGDDINGALDEIETYCKVKCEPLVFCCIDEKIKDELLKRYPAADVSFNRDWSDYIYLAQDFKTFSGKKFSGQRNHVNKFAKTYPDYAFKQITADDFPRIAEFFKAYERETVANMWTEVEEENKVVDYIYNMFKLKQVGGYIETSGKIVALSIGEVVGDVLIVHVEKGLKEFAGVYPTMAREFAKAFAADGVTFINREEDCGDAGLRVSKTQYHPIEIKNKYVVRVKTPFDFISPPIYIKTERLTIEDVTEKDKEVYARICKDDDLNAYYGYDYREDLNGCEPTADYFYGFMQSLKDKKEEYSFAVKKDGEIVGELVLYNFNYRGEAEIGFRFLREYQGAGYAYESASALVRYATEVCGATAIACRAYKKNLPSLSLIKKLGFEKVRETEEMCFFRKKFNK